MKILLFAAVLLKLMITGFGMPIEEESAIDVTISGLDDNSDDMEGSESSLKVIEHKLDHWLKKYYKKTDKLNNNNAGFAAFPFPQSAFPLMGYPIMPLMGYPLTGYGYGGLGGLNGFNFGLLGGGLGSGFAPGLGGFGTGLGGYGYGTGLGSYGGYGYR